MPWNLDKSCWALAPDVSAMFWHGGLDILMNRLHNSYRICWNGWANHNGEIGSEWPPVPYGTPQGLVILYTVNLKPVITVLEDKERSLTCPWCSAVLHMSHRSETSCPHCNRSKDRNLIRFIESIKYPLHMAWLSTDTSSHTQWYPH